MHLRFRLLLTFAFAGLASPVEAQRVAGNSRATTPARDSQLDMLRPYGSRPSAPERPYARQRPTRPAPSTPAPPRTLHTYFPTMRTGQGPNLNTAPIHLCVPGRRATLPGR